MQEREQTFSKAVNITKKTEHITICDILEIGELKNSIHISLFFLSFLGTSIIKKYVVNSHIVSGTYKGALEDRGDSHNSEPLMRGYLLY